ncbi:ribonuclease H-like domain-containing protein, partial [Tanacetum coccineum]
MSKEYNNFMQNYNMHSMGKNVNELHAMLKLHEQTLPKKDVAPALHVIRAGKPKETKPELHKGLRGSKKLKPGALSLYMGNGIISVSHLYDDGFVNRFENNAISVSMYAVSNKKAKLNLDSSLLWHCRLRHVSKKCIENLQHDGLLNSTDIKSFEKYVSCMSGKMTRKPYSHQVKRAKHLLGLIHTDEAIQKGNGPVNVSKDKDGQLRVLPPKNAKETLAREREIKARTTLLMALPEDHLARFHKMDDAKEMFQSLLSQLEIHGAGVFTKDANQKFLRSLPASWSQVSLIMRTKPGVDTLSFDDLYNNLRVFDTNDVSTAYGVSSSSGHNSQKEGSSSYTDELKYSFFANQSSGSKENQESRRRDAGNTRYKAKDNRRRPRKQEEPKALVTLDRDGVDWTGHAEDEQENFSLMAHSNSGSNS